MTVIGSTEAAAYLVFDAESVPDGRLLRLTKYPGEAITDDEAVARAQAEAMEASGDTSDFIPVTFHVPVAVCAAQVNREYELTDLTALGAPAYHPRAITTAFWQLAVRAGTIVSFNGRGFDVPLLEINAFRYGVPVPAHFAERYSTRDRYGRKHFDLMDWLCNYGASRLNGGLNLLSKLLGKPGKMGTTGGQVYDLFRAGNLPAINHYCSFDVLDTYFVFLRTQVLMGKLTIKREQEIVGQTKQWLESHVLEQPHLMTYVENWGDWNPWP